jgi:hypothetical protein
LVLVGQATGLGRSGANITNWTGLKNTTGQNLDQPYKTRKAMPLYRYTGMASCETNRYQLIFTIPSKFIKPLQL